MVHTPSRYIVGQGQYRNAAASGSVHLWRVGWMVTRRYRVTVLTVLQVRRRIFEAPMSRRVGFHADVTPLQTLKLCLSYQIVLMKGVPEKQPQNTQAVGDAINETRR